MKTLVLNQAYQPIGVFTWKRAIKKVFSEKAEILATYAESKLNDWSVLEAPAVIRLLHFLNPPKKHRYEPFSRKNIWLRDNGKCQYCGTSVSLRRMTFDHVTPRYYGGRTNWTNIVTACLFCNNKKGNKRLAESGMSLLNKPIAPIRRLSLQQEMVLRLKNLTNLPCESWKTYIYFELPLLDT
jgi:5-methylcytosine-specific restriction endonuclease McrA